MSLAGSPSAESLLPEVLEPRSPGLRPPRKLESLNTGPVAVTGPAGNVRRIQISVQDTPESIEHCLRAVFRVERNAGLVLLNRAGCAVPLGIGLLCPPGADGQDASGPIYRLDVTKPDMCQTPTKFCKAPEGLSVMIPQDARDRSRNNSVCSTYRMIGYEDEEYGMEAQGSPGLPEKNGGAWPTEIQPNRLSIVPVAPSEMDASKLSILPPSAVVGHLSNLPAHKVHSDDCKKPVEISPNSNEVSTHDPPGIVEDLNVCHNFSKQTTQFSEQQFSDMRPTRTAVPEEMQSSELQYWYEIAEGFRKLKSSLQTQAGRRSSIASHCSQADSSAEEFLNVAAFDTSDMRIDSMYAQWRGAQPLTRARLAKQLRREHGVSVSLDELSEGLNRIREYIQVGDDDESISRPVFGAFWQRLLIGAAYRRAYQKRGACFEIDPLQLVEYSEHMFDVEGMMEEDMLFRSPLKIKRTHGTPAPNENLSKWVRCNSASADRLLRLGLKFYLHPLATGDAIAAGRNGMTKIDRHGHQYFVSLEVYMLQDRNYYSNDEADDREPMKVGPNISRYGMYLVATGNPKGGHRDWLLSIIGERSEGIQDPLDFFKADSDAAKSILDKVQSDLEAHGQLREYQADFLLYTVIDRAASEFMPICLAYGHRLQWLQRSLKTLKLSLPGEYVDEVAKMLLEMQELKQWIGQLRGIVKTLSQDCKASKKGQSDNAGVPWNFGAHTRGSGKSVAMFLCKTEAHIDEMCDRLSTLGELAHNFLDHHERHRDAFVNNILLTLTIATAVFMPAQLLAGIYGTNFVDQDGVPTIPELNWKYGYWYFLVTCVVMIVSGLLLARYCLRRA